MPTKIGSTQIKKIIYGGTNVKKAYCNGVQIFSADHTVTYQLKGTSWTATVEDGENAAAISSVNTTASSKMGSGDTFLGWTTGSGTTPSSTITCDADSMTLYGIWKHTHVGNNTTNGGCYCGGSSSSNQHSIINLGGVSYDSCGCQHQSWQVRCNVCGSTWNVTCNNSIPCTNDPKHQNGACTYPGDRSSCPNGHAANTTVYALSCGKSAGTFRG